MSNSRTHIMFVDADKSPGIDQMLDRVIPWVLQSEQAYYCELFERYNPRRTMGRWISTPDSEHSLHKMRLLIADDRLAGGFVGFAGRQLRRRRESDLVDLARHARDLRSNDLRRRLKDLIPLFGPVSPDDYYISTFGVSAAFDRRKLFEPLVAECLEQADNEGFERVRIDTDADDELLPPFLLNHGFEIEQKRRATEADLTYLNMVRSI